MNQQQQIEVGLRWQHAFSTNNAFLLLRTVLRKVCHVFGTTAIQVSTMRARAKLERGSIEIRWLMQLMRLSSS